MRSAFKLILSWLYWITKNKYKKNNPIHNLFKFSWIKVVKKEALTALPTMEPQNSLECPVSQEMHAQSHCCVQQFVTLWMIAGQAPLSMWFSRQEYWSGLSCTYSRDLPEPGIRSVSTTSPALASEFFIIEPSGKPKLVNICS